MTQPIERGSFIITDAFANSLAFTDLNITKAVPILLPIWSSNLGMYINGVDLGLTNGTIDPNLLMADALTKHWINLTRTSAKWRNSANQNGPGGFAEQAFIKCMKRLNVTKDFSGISAMPKSVNENTLTLLTWTEDLQTRKIILNLNSSDVACNASLTQSKPLYLLPDALPTVQTDFMINSFEKALYDAGLNYYNVNETECQKFNFVNSTSRDFDFNAILVYFDDAGAEDLGGIYFVNKWEQNGSFWQIAPNSKRENNTFSFDINMISNGAKVIQWHAENGSLPDALLLYENLFRENYKLEQQVIALTKQLEALTVKVDSMNSLLTITNINELSALANALSAVNQNDKAAILTAAVSLAYDNQLQSDFVMPKSAGNYVQGQIIPAGTDINMVLINILA
jgi:hypothetical protein